MEKDLTGVLFKNDKKEKETHPDAKGSALINGVEYWISAWRNNTKEGKPYTSLKFEQKQPKITPLAEPEPTQESGDGLPF